MKYRRYDVLSPDKLIRLKLACVQYALRERGYYDYYLGKPQIAVMEQPVWYIDYNDMAKHADPNGRYYIGVLCKI